MDTQNKTNKNVEEYSGYEGYSQNDAPSAEVVEKTINRDLMLLEYDVDKDVILGAIKKALKERNYEEAQEFVYHYRAAAKTDEQFEILAKMTADAMKNKKDAEKIQLVLDATPEDDYEVRLSLSERLFKLIPDDENLEQVNHYRSVLHKKPISRELAKKESKAPESVVTAARGVAHGICVTVCIAAILWSMGFIALLALVFSGGLLAVIPAAELLFHIVSLVKQTKKETSAPKSVKRCLINTSIVIGVALLVFILIIF